MPLAALREYIKSSAEKHQLTTREAIVHLLADIMHLCHALDDLEGECQYSELESDAGNLYMDEAPTE